MKKVTFSIKPATKINLQATLRKLKLKKSHIKTQDDLAEALFQRKDLEELVGQCMEYNKGLRATVEITTQIMLKEELANPTILTAHNTAQAVYDFKIKALEEIKNKASLLTVDDIKIMEIKLPSFKSAIYQGFN